MRAIYKYPLPLQDEEVLMLRGEVLSVGEQDGGRWRQQLPERKHHEGHQ